MFFMLFMVYFLFYICLNHCHGIWTRAKPQRQRVFEIFASLRLERVKRVGARHFYGSGRRHALVFMKHWGQK